MDEEPSGPPFKTGRGLLAKYGPAPSTEEIDANRADMFRVLVRLLRDRGSRRYACRTLAFV